MRMAEDFPDTNSQDPGGRPPARLKASWPDMGTPTHKPASSYDRWCVFAGDRKVSECKTEAEALRLHQLFGGNPKKPWRGSVCIRRYSLTEGEIQTLQAKARAEKRWQGGWGA